MLYFQQNHCENSTIIFIIMASSYNVLNDNDTVVQQDPKLSTSTNDEMKRSWQALNHTVHTARKLHAKFANSIPHQFSFIATSNKSEFDRGPGSQQKNSQPTNLRVLFLGIPRIGNYDRTLLYVDIPLSEDQCYMDSPPQWKQVFKTVQVLLKNLY